MKVTVHIAPVHIDSKPDTIEEFENADGWHIDDERQLHIKKSGGGNLAAYGVNAWLSVREADATSSA